MTAENRTRAVYWGDVPRFHLVDLDFGRTRKDDQQILTNKDHIIGEQVILVRSGALSFACRWTERAFREAIGLYQAASTLPSAVALRRVKVARIFHLASWTCFLGRNVRYFQRLFMRKPSSFGECIASR